MSIITSDVLMEISQEGKVSQDKEQLQQESLMDPKHSTTKIGTFILNRNALLGSGSFSKVYRGYDISNQKMQVAIKVIQKSKLNQDLQRLVDSEMKILRLINHPNIVKCYEILEDQASIYIVMELCEEGDLETRIDKNGAVAEAEAVTIVKGVFRGLMYLSEMNVIHRDIKVANIFMSNNVPKIADFGFAIHNKTKKQFQDISIGSPIYMSPQGIKHNVYGPKTDIWAFGIFIYELLHGKTPYSHCTKEKELKYNISSPINWSSFKAGLSYSIKDLMLKCLEVNYEKRISFEKLKNHDIFQDLFQDVKHSDTSRGKTLGKFSYFYSAKTQTEKKLQAGLMTPNFTSIDSPQAQQGFKDYCKRLQKELSINLSTKNYQKTFLSMVQQKLKIQFDERNHRETNFLRLLSPQDKKANKSKSRETPRTREQISSLEKKRHQNISSSEQYSNHMVNSKRKACLNSFDRLKSQPIANDLLGQYKQYYGNDKNESRKKRAKKSSNDQTNDVLPTFGVLNGHRVTKSNHNDNQEFSFVNQFSQDRLLDYKNTRNQSFKYGHKHTQSIRNRVNSPNLRILPPQKEDLRLDFSQKTYAQNFLRMPKQKEDFHSLRSNNKKSLNKVNCQRSNKVSQDYNNFYTDRNITVRNEVNQANHSFINLTFPVDNIDCYMYLMHFSRLLYKFSCNLQIKPYLWEIRDVISSLCLKILYEVVKKIQSAYGKSLRSKINSQSDLFSHNVFQIQQTALKYISQYESQFQTFSIHQNYNTKLVNSKLQNQLNSMLQKQIKSHKPQCRESVKLMYLGWVYLVHFRDVLSEYFMSDQAQRYWLEYNCQNAVKFLEQDIEVSNTMMKVETYLKLKRKLQDRRY